LRETVSKLAMVWEVF